MKIYYTNKFTSSYKKLPDQIKSLAEQKEKMFRVDPFDPRLGTHKLGGRLGTFWAFSITQRYRIEFKFLGNREALFLKAGTHNIYRN